MPILLPNPGLRIVRMAAMICAGFLATTLSSCKSLGPGTIPRDGFDYNKRIADQENEQLLLNIVRLRYFEMPRFLNVASLINSYSRGGSAGLNANGGPFGNSLSGGLDGNWSDRPTITYTPMTGQAFAQSLLTPLPPSVIFFLIQSGWSAQRLMRLTNSVINGIHNENGIPDGRRQADPQFQELLEVIYQLQQEGALGMRFNGDWPKVDVEIVVPKNPRTESARVAVERFKELLEIKPDKHVFDIEYGVVAQKKKEIVMQTHSIMEMLSNIAWYIEVPEEHIAEGRTLSTFLPNDPDLIRIRVADSRPQDAFQAIEYRGYWYYIDDRDVKSKNTFTVMQILMSMAKDGSGAVGPLISIGN